MAGHDKRGTFRAKGARLPLHSAKNHQQESPLPASLPTSYLRLLLQATGATDKHTQTLMKRAGLQTSATQVPLAEQLPLFEYLLAQTTNPMLGWQLGLQMQLALHGQLGAAFYSADHLDTAVQLLEKFLPVRAPIFTLSIKKQASGWWLQLQPSVPLGTLARFFTHATVAAVCSAIGSYAGRSFSGKICLPSFGIEEQAESFQPFPQRVSFDAECAKIFLAKSILGTSSLMSDTDQHASALALCEQAIHNQSALTLPQRLLKLFSETQGQRLTQELAAQHLHISARTLNRHLNALGTSFHQLHSEHLHRTARQLLNNPHLSVDAIAAQLGFHDGASFRRSFKRWEGVTPSGFRQAQTHERLVK